MTPYGVKTSLAICAPLSISDNIEMCALPSRRKRARGPVTQGGQVRRRLLSNYWTMELRLRAGTMCAADLTMGSDSYENGTTCLEISESCGRHGHGTNLLLARIPAVVISAQYCPPVACKELPFLVSVTVCEADQLELSAVSSETPSRTRGWFAFGCSCKSEAGCDGDMDLSPKCEHAKIVRDLLISQNGLSGTGNSMKALLEQASIAMVDSRTRSEDNEVPEELSALSFTVSSSKLLSEIACMYWSSCRRTGEAVPILIRLSKRIREEHIKVDLRCSRCPGDNIRPSCKHELRCANQLSVREAVARESSRISGAQSGNAPCEPEEEDVAFKESDIGGNVCSATDSEDHLCHSSDEDGDKKVSEAAEDAGTPILGKEFQSYARRMMLPCLSDVQNISKRAAYVRESSTTPDHRIVKLGDEYGQCCNMACRIRHCLKAVAADA